MKRVTATLPDVYYVPAASAVARIAVHYGITGQKMRDMVQRFAWTARKYGLRMRQHDLVFEHFCRHVWLLQRQVELDTPYVPNVPALQRLVDRDALVLTRLIALTEGRAEVAAA